MSDDSKRGDHDYVDAHDPKVCPAGCLPIPVIAAERAAIKKRREYIKYSGNRDRTAYPSFTGLALSGGGVRSASFGLGALQALHVQCGIEGIDYLSTVSGGGYIGCSLTATTQDSAAEQDTPGIERKVETQKNKDKFPFTNADNYDDTAAVRHIRDFSKYLAPHGALDVVTALGIIGRGLVANAIIVAPVLLFFAWITLLIHPTVESLGKPNLLIQYLIKVFPSLSLLLSLPGYWFSAILIAVNLLFLIVWAFFTSVNLGSSATLRGGWVGVSRIIFVVTLITVLIETQPFILWLISPNAGEAGSSILGHYINALRSWLLGVLSGISSYAATIGTILASMGTVFAFLSKYLGDIVAEAKHATGWIAWLKKLSAMAALWLAAAVVPIVLWLCYLRLTDIGLSYVWARWSFFVTFVVLALLALFINPNRTSLYRLYRDRLSKAFLFDPDGGPGKRDKYGDLQERNPKLHEIDTDLCPYPILNAALNIEGSRYANKRGRNADFFVFTPEYVGSDATGYIGSRQIQEKEPTLDLGTAMAISGAAVSSNMGALTIKPLAFTLAVFNVRLGYWMRSPYIFHKGPGLLSRLLEPRSFLLFKEMFSFITEKSPTVLLTDGGHIENLGVYPLLKRRCKVILAIDAEADPLMSFNAFLELERYARIDLGVIIDLPWRAIRDCTIAVNKAFDKADDDGSAIPFSLGPHCAAGEIQYGPNETGTLLYVKASLSGDEDDYILDYKRRYRDFPHESTGDQFFSEEQLEVYRALGFHIMKGVLTGEKPFAVKQNTGEGENQARQRIRGEIFAALGRWGKPPDSALKPTPRIQSRESAPIWDPLLGGERYRLNNGSFDSVKA